MKSIFLVVMINIVIVGASNCFASVSRGTDLTEPSLALVRRLESRLKMPKGAFPIDTYVRYYALDRTNTHQKIRGKFIYDPNNAGVRLVVLNKIPQVKDGGCSVLTIEFDLDRNRMTAFYCNQDS